MTYPQLSTGALSQYPTRKRRRNRTVMNTLPDGRKIKLPDVGGQTTEWQLQYIGLSDAELETMQEFFASAEGSLIGFTFLDPCGNLLAWSGDLTQSEWQTDPFVALTGAVMDPLGGQNAWHVVNSGAGTQQVAQTLNAPGLYVYCFSVYLRAAEPTSIALRIGTASAELTAESDWKRVSICGTGEASALSVSFGIEVPAGSAVDVFGPQVEPQTTASAYQVSTTGGVYENARFADDALSHIATDVNRHSMTVNIVYANHL